MKKLIWLVFALMMLTMVSVGAAQASLDGIWESDGYGYIFVVNESAVQTVYEVSSVHCVISDVPIPLSELHPTLENEQLIIRDTRTVYITAHHLDALPETCNDAPSVDTPNNDPEANFEAFWNTFNEQYAFFDLYGVDWQAQYDTYRPQITAKTTPDELYKALCDMIQPLKDGHISLTSDQQSCQSDVFPTWITEPGRQAALLKVINGLQVIGKTYLDGDVHLDLQAGRLAGDEALLAGDYIFYGHLSDQVGYVNIITMTPFGDAGDDTVFAAMDRVIADLADVKTMIVDVRYNSGGYDSVGLGLASRFADQKRVAFTKQARNGDTFTPLREYTIEPQGKAQFTGNVLLLTSGLTVSAAETFTLAMESLPYVTQIGETTLGAYSDILSRTLPNGWHYGLSNERYFNSAGVSYEGDGNPPAVEVPVDLSAYDNERDNIIDAAVEYAATLTTP